MSKDTLLGKFVKRFQDWIQNHFFYFYRDHCRNVKRSFMMS